jgi:D-citramalate synthase
MNKANPSVDILDTTLRDGEQMRNVSYSPEEKLNIARYLLKNVGVRYLEIASARVSKGEEEASERILAWASANGYGKQVEILGFVDSFKSVEWIASRGGRVINLLAKGSLKHLVQQLKKRKEQHVAEIRETIAYAGKRGILCNLYLEDWSNGMLHSPEYVYYLIEQLHDAQVQRFMLPDTLGILYPNQVTRFLSDLLPRFPGIVFDFHAHNDYGMATANTLVAVETGIQCVHCTVNGMGERAGNAPLDEVVIGIHDFLHGKTGIDENNLYRASQMVEVYSGCRIAFNKPISGSNVFTQTAGIHADGDRKGDLYVSSLKPERFRRKRQYALGKLSGKSSLEYNLAKINADLTQDQKKLVLERIIELGDRKEAITDADLPYIIADVLETPHEKAFQLKSYVVVTSMGLLPLATIKMVFKDPKKKTGMELEESAQGDGGYDAFMNALKKICLKISFPLPKLTDYGVSIPTGGKTDALVQCSITWQDGDTRFLTKGVNSDQVLAAIEATEKMLNLMMMRRQTIKKTGGGRP